MSYIYALKKDGKVFYVGMTEDLAMRLHEHRRAFNDRTLTACTLEKCAGSARAYREAYWIQKLLLEGVELINKKNRQGGVHSAHHPRYNRMKVVK